MKTAVLLFLALAGCLAGCASFKLPDVQGDLVQYNRHDPIGGTVITAKGVKVTDTLVEAEEVHWVTTYPQFSIDLHVVNYKRARTATDKPMPQPTPAK